LLKTGCGAIPHSFIIIISLGVDMSSHKERDPNTTKSGKPKLHSKPLAELQAMVKSARPKNIPVINRAIMKKVGRGG
jgi:hypothetical protein